MSAWPVVLLVSPPLPLSRQYTCSHDPGDPSPPAAKTAGPLAASGAWDYIGGRDLSGWDGPAEQVIATAEAVEDW